LQLYYATQLIFFEYLNKENTTSKHIVQRTLM